MSALLFLFNKNQIINSRVRINNWKTIHEKIWQEKAFKHGLGASNSTEDLGAKWADWALVGSRDEEGRERIDL